MELGRGCCACGCCCVRCGLLCLILLLYVTWQHASFLLAPFLDTSSSVPVAAFVAATERAKDCTPFLPPVLSYKLERSSLEAARGCCALCCSCVRLGGRPPSSLHPSLPPDCRCWLQCSSQQQKQQRTAVPAVVVVCSVSAG